MVTKFTKVSYTIGLIFIWGAALTNMAHKCLGRRILDVMPPYPDCETTPVNIIDQVEAPMQKAVVDIDQELLEIAPIEGDEATSTAEPPDDEVTGEPPQSAGEATPESSPTDATDAAAESTADHTNGEPTGATQDTESSPHAATQKTPRPTGHNLLARLSMN